MTGHALLGAFVIVFCVAGLAVGIVRLAPGSDAVDLLFAAVAGLAGAAVFAFAVRVGPRGSPAWTKWLIVPILISAFFLDRLSERNLLALIGLCLRLRDRVSCDRRRAGRSPDALVL